jgi:signal peptidase I
VTTTTLPRPRLRSRGLITEILDTIILIGAIYALVNLASVRFIVEGPSMQPNFYTRQVLVVSRVNYLFGLPQRGDIIVFNPPNQPPDEPPYIKRVIGMPGDTVAIRDTQVYVNDKKLNEPYINEPCTEGRCRDNSWELGPNQYFVMGDNRNHSSDSRAFGPITLDHVIGEALIRYWPPPAWGIVSQIAYPGDAN